MSKSAPFEPGTNNGPKTVLDTRQASAAIDRPRGTSYQRFEPDTPVRLTGRSSQAAPPKPPGQRSSQPSSQPTGRREWLTEDEVERIIKHAACNAIRS